jgi:hypothetical protein
MVLQAHEDGCPLRSVAPRLRAQQRELDDLKQQVYDVLVPLVRAQQSAIIGVRNHAAELASELDRLKQFSSELRGFPEWIDAQREKFELLVAQRMNNVDEYQREKMAELVVQRMNDVDQLTKRIDEFGKKPSKQLSDPFEHLLPLPEVLNMRGLAYNRPKAKQ